MIDGFYSLNNVSKFFGPRKIIDSISYNFYRGKIYAILGDSGSGKTTLLNILGLLDNKYEGEIFINGQSMAKNKDNFRTRNQYIGFVFQSYYLIDYLNVKQNIYMPLDYAKNKIDIDYYIDLLKRLNIESIENENANYLSGGEKQRVAIARAFINKPNIIICDEPTGNLDQKNANQVMSTLRSFLTKDKLAIVVTHDREIAMSCDVILKLEDGKLYEKQKGI